MRNGTPSTVTKVKVVEVTPDGVWVETDGGRLQFDSNGKEYGGSKRCEREPFRLWELVDCVDCQKVVGEYNYCLKCLEQMYDPADLNGPDRQGILEQRPGYTPGAYHAGKIIKETFGG
jgi:hypothetical protein